MAGPEVKTAESAKNSLAMNFFWFVLVALLVANVVSNVYSSTHKELFLENVTLYRLADTIAFQGVYARDERILQDAPSGVIIYTHKDGSKMAAGSVVAQSYATTRDVQLQGQIAEAKRQLKLLEEAAQLQDVVDGTQLRNYVSGLRTAHGNISKAIASGDYAYVLSQKDDILSLLCKKQIVRGDKTSLAAYQARIALLENNIAKSESNVTRPPTDVDVSEAGYFVSKVDGYEDELNMDNLDLLSKDELLDIIRHPNSDDIVTDKPLGKIISGYVWKMAGILETDKIHGIFVGATAKVSVAGQAVDMTVEGVTTYPDGYSVVIFSCDRLSDIYVEKRADKFKLILDEYYGIRVPSKAIHFDETGADGVYVKSSTYLTFKKIDKIRSEADYVLVKDTSKMPGFLSLYDNVVVEGIDLYEGKIVMDANG